jgi:hypothetical protein
MFYIVSKQYIFVTLFKKIEGENYKVMLLSHPPRSLAFSMGRTAEYIFFSDAFLLAALNIYIIV